MSGTASLVVFFSLLDLTVLFALAFREAIFLCLYPGCPWGALWELFNIYFFFLAWARRGPLGSALGTVVRENRVSAGCGRKMNGERPRRLFGFRDIILGCGDLRGQVLWDAATASGGAVSAWKQRGRDRQAWGLSESTLRVEEAWGCYFMTSWQDPNQ